ncbi:MlaD family protein [Candidatus Liberibacter asiaticus]|uniref:MlaD family protein n=1 Tax=Liberibacter asiaticus TaxID=34021 RepID=UPI0009BF543A|nr:MlaD family protein [Candidatus Liberibacter asiaticus]
MMESKNYYTSVGLFVVSILFFSFFSIYWLSRSNQYDGPMAEVIIRIPGSVDGLSTDSSVRFNGIPVGRIVGLFLDQEYPNHSLAKALIRPDTPLYPSTTARIRTQGLAGITYIELSTLRKEKKTIFQIATERNQRAMITATPSGINYFISNAENTSKKISDSSRHIQKIIENIEKPLTTTIANIETISTVLANNISHIDKMMHTTQVTPHSSDSKNTFNTITDLITSLDKMIKAIDLQKVNQILENIQVSSNNFVKSSDQVINTVHDVRETTQTFQEVGQKIDHLLSDFSSKMKSKETSAFLENIADSTSNMRSSISAIREITDQRQKIISTINTIENITSNLNDSSQKFAELMSKINNISALKENNSLFKDAQRAMHTFRDTSEKINRYIPSIGNNLQNFSQSGLNDIQNLVRKLQETVNHFDDCLNNFERNPQDIVWGREKGSVKIYKPKH